MGAAVIEGSRGGFREAFLIPSEQRPEGREGMKQGAVWSKHPKQRAQ